MFVSAAKMATMPKTAESMNASNHFASVDIGGHQYDPHILLGDSATDAIDADQGLERPRPIGALAKSPPARFPLSGAKRTRHQHRKMSANDPKRKSVALIMLLKSRVFASVQQWLVEGA